MRYFLLVFSFFPILLTAQGIQFLEKTPAEAIAIAQQTGKHVFIDFGAAWCRPCQMMEQSTFKDDSLGRFFNRHFVSVKVDADKQPEWIKYYQVDTYPELMILNAEGQPKWIYTSYVDAAFLLHNAKKTIQFFEEKYAYNKNPKDAVLLRKYVESIPTFTEWKDSGKHVVQRFLAQFPQSEWIKSPYWELITQYIKDIESPEYQYFLNHANEYTAFHDKIKPYIFDNLLSVKNQNLKKPYQAEWEAYKVVYIKALQAFKEMTFPQDYYLQKEDLTFFAAKRDEAAYLNTAQSFLTQFGEKQAMPYAQIAMEIMQNFRLISPLWKNAEEWASKALVYEPLSMYPNYVYAYLKYRQKDPTTALKYAEKAQNLASDGTDKQQITDLIVKIKAMK